VRAAAAERTLTEHEKRRDQKIKIENERIYATRLKPYTHNT
jgi:hypothetical protein